MKQVVVFNQSRFEKVGLTQRAVARKLGWDEAYLSKVVTGKVEPGVLKAIQIAKALKCKPEDLWSVPKKSKRR